MLIEYQNWLRSRGFKVVVLEHHNDRVAVFSVEETLFNVICELENAYNASGVITLMKNGEGLCTLKTEFGEMKISQSADPSRSLIFCYR